MTTTTEQRTDAPTKAARPSGEIEQALYDERDRLVDALFRYGHGEGHCSTLLSALYDVYLTREPQWSDGTWRDSEGRDYHGYDVEGYDTDGYHRRTGLNREGRNYQGRTEAEHNRQAQEEDEARRVADQARYNVRNSPLAAAGSRWCSTCQTTHTY